MGEEEGTEREETHTFRFRAVQGYEVEEAGGYTQFQFETREECLFLKHLEQHLGLWDMRNRS